MTNTKNTYFGKKGWVLAIGLSVFLLSALVPVTTVTPGLTVPEPIGKFLNDNLPNRTPSSGGNVTWSVVPAFPNLSFNDPLVLTMHPDPSENIMFVASRAGFIEHFDASDPSVANKSTAADFTNETAVVHDGGFLGMAFHPQWGNNPSKNYVYLYYIAKGDDNGNCFGPPNGGCDGFCFSCANNGRWYGSYMRLARYEVNESSGNYTIDKNSELRMINLPQYNATHRGGGLTFGDDGFLYLTIGDQARRTTAQEVQTNFEGGVIRIDVDQQGGSVSHAPTYKISTTAALPKYDFYNPGDTPVNTATNQVTGVGYYIPNDNPDWFTNGTSYFEEFFTVGHRAPHRMTKDRLTGDLWIGEIGAGSREEINVLQPNLILQNWQNVRAGNNYGWPKHEGFLVGQFTPCGSNNLNLTLGVNNNIGPIDPVVDFFRSGSKGANAIIGGYVYRGSKFSGVLGGKYICGGYSQNRIFAISFTADGNGKIIADTGGGSNQDAIEVLTSFSPGAMVTFGEDHAGELYIGKLGTGVPLYTLKASGLSNPAPNLLSQTGAFQDLTNLTPATGVIPYELVEPFWSDGAIKKRWLAVPSDVSGLHTNVDEQIRFSENGEWQYPKGTVLIKHFEMETSPGVIRRLETRFEVLGDDNSWYYLTYKWNSGGTDAELLVSGETETLTVNGQPQDWVYPSTSECQVCHQGSVGSVLGPKTRNLNRSIVYPKTGINANQLVTLSHLGILDQTIMDEDVANFLTLSGKGDNGASLEDRARSYIDVNCSYCHRPETGNRAVFDGRFTTPLDMQNLIYGAVISPLNLNDPRIVVPQDVPRSMLHHRMNSLANGVAMPPIAKNKVDDPGVQLIVDWINSLTPSVSQDMVTTGDAGVLSGGCYEITPAQTSQVGAAWYPNPIDLSQDLLITFTIGLGSNDAGGDGMALVFQNQGTSLDQSGALGGGLGASGISPSLGVEFDTYNGGGPDIADDHIAIWQNGNLGQPLLTSNCMAPNCANVEDGEVHNVEVRWNAANRQLSVFFDNEFRGQYVGDVVQDIFEGNGTVYVGVTGGTGGAFNQQTICGFMAMAVPVSPIVPADGEGLTANYYNNLDFTSPVLNRIDPVINFDWGGGSPDPTIGADTYSVLWEGEVLPESTGNYTFYTITDDGVRLWVNNQQIINQWSNFPPTEFFGSVSLTGGQKVPIRMEYYENGGGAVAQLSWSGPNIVKQIIPQKNLFHTGTPNAAFTATPMTGTLPLTVDFDASASSDPNGDPLVYAWDFGEGTTAFGVNASHTYTVEGTYTVQLTVSDGRTGCMVEKNIVVNPPPCIEVTFNTEDFEDGWGLWNDGGADADRVDAAAFASSGTFSIQLKDDTDESVMTTNPLNLSKYFDLTIDFSYYVESFDNASEDFWLQISTDGGTAFSTIAEWNEGDEFNSGEQNTGSVSIDGPFSANTLLRFRCDASGDGDYVYIDDVVIRGCRENVAPVADMVVSTAMGRAPVLVGFDGSCSYDPDDDELTYVWNFGDGTSDNGNFPFTEHAYSAPGVYIATLTVSDGNLNDVNQQSITVVAPPTCSFLSADFDAGTEGFSYLDDAFQNTNQPAYAQGDYQAAGGYQGGALRVELGAINGNDVFNMSGGWEYVFSLSQPTELSISLRYNLIFDIEYESDEYGRALMSFDNTLYGQGGNEYLAQLTGGVSGTVDQSTGWQLFQVDLGLVAAGNHSLKIGAFNNKKTFDNERTQLFIDDVEIGTTGGGATPVASFTTNISGGPAPVPILFDASGSTNNGSGELIYQWDFGDGTTRSGITATHTYNFPGLYSVVLTVDNGICEGQVNQLVSIGQPVADLGIFTKQTDLGGVAISGSVVHDGGLYTVRGSGADIWNSADEQQFIFRPHRGDGEIIARVQSMTNTNTSAKAGLLFRASSDPAAPAVMVAQRPDGQVSFQWRSANGGNSSWSGSWEGGTGNVKFLRLVRNANLFTAFYSTTTARGPWIQIGSGQTITMPAEVLIGLGVTSRDDGILCTAEFGKVRIGNIAGPAALIVNAKVYLQGPWNGTGLNLHLYDAGLVPLTQPFSAQPWNFAGLEQVGVIPPNAIDWVMVRLMDSSDQQCILAERACFVRNDGLLMDLDGTIGVDFGVIPIGAAFISIQHRNHLGIMTDGAVNLLGE